MHNMEMQKALDEVFEAGEEEALGICEAASRLDGGRVRTALMECSRDSARGLVELQSAVAAAGGRWAALIRGKNPSRREFARPPAVTAAGSAAGGGADGCGAVALIATIVRQQRRLMGACLRALQAPLPPGLRAVINRQYSRAIQRGRRIRELGESNAEATAENPGPAGVAAGPARARARGGDAC